MKKSIRRITTAVLTALVLTGVVATTAVANSPQVLQDVERAAQQAGVDPAIGSLPVIQSGGQVTTKTPGGIDLAVPVGKVTKAAEGTIVEGDGQSEFVFQNIGGGIYRASVHISSPNDPEQYEFNVKGASHLLKLFDGSVQAFNAEGQLVAEIETPWAIDKNGKDVPTYYKTDGATLTQVVEHQKGNYGYGITADPRVKLKWFGYEVKFNRQETAALAGAGTGSGALASRLVAGPAGVGLAVAGIVVAAHAAAALAEHKCLKYQSGAPLVKPFKIVKC